MPRGGFVFLWGATVNVYFSAYRFLYTQVLKRPDHQFSIPRRGRSGTRPGVLNRQEVDRLIAAPRNLKHCARLAMAAANRKETLAAIRQALHVQAPPAPAKASLAERLLHKTGVDITLCPHCGHSLR